MSKIIKAHFVVERRLERLKKIEQDGTARASGEAGENTRLTRETAEAIYFETKTILEDLIAQAQQRSDAIILKAREEAQQIVENALGDVSNTKVESWDKGYAQGYEAGYAEAADELQRRYGEISSLLRELTDIRLELYENQEKEIVQLILAMTEKILGTIVDLRPEIISQVIRNTLEQAKGAQKITVKINPVHLPYLSRAEEIFKETGAEVADVVEEPALKPGDCQVITENGFIEAIIEEQLLELKRVLLETADYD